ncbi:MAG: hypothetical protein PVF87_01850 [Acidimicrobiia bacterium]|jgi:hypothetical protein
MTREVRWFFHGPLPGDFHEWFTSTTHTREYRVDVYDLASARNVAGCKGASTTSRWITIGSGEQPRVAVCCRHAAGDLDPSMVTREDA